MNKFAKVITGITVIVLLFSVYLVVGAQVRVELIETKVEAASERADAFNRAKAMMGMDTLEPGQFRMDPLNNVQEYSFITYRLSITNIGLLPAEWIEVGVTPGSADVMQISVDAKDLGALQRDSISTSILTLSTQTSVPRVLWVEYYVFGHKVSVHVNT